MVPYTRHQLLLLLIVLAAAGVGLAVREWRAAHPELAERLEQFDREPPSGPRPPPAAPEPPPSAPEPAPGRWPARGADHATRAGDDPRVAPAHSPAGRPLDLNRATLEELTGLPGVGAVLATRILEAREGRGRFVSVEDLRRVRGLGGARLERLRPLVTVATPR